MRTIKFRAWNKKAKSMEYDFDISSQGDVFKINMFETVEQKDWTLMQSTGVFAKNGQEIFEGDICKRSLQDKNYKDSEKWCDYWLIEWLPRTSGFTTTYIGKYDVFSKQFQPERALPNSYSQRFNEMDEVVGNIYQNPELLTPQTPHP